MNTDTGKETAEWLTKHANAPLRKRGKRKQLTDWIKTFEGLKRTGKIKRIKTTEEIAFDAWWNTSFDSHARCSHKNRNKQNRQNYAVNLCFHPFSLSSYYSDSVFKGYSDTVILPFI